MKSWVGVIVGAALLAGCSSNPFASLMPGHSSETASEPATEAAGSSDTYTNTDVVVTGTRNTDEQALIAEQQSKIDELEKKLAATEQELMDAEADSQAASSTSTSTSAGFVADDRVPPDAKPGTCYARLVIPAEYKTVTDTVQVREGSETIDIIPARYELADEQVLVRESETRIEVVPAVYDTVEEQVLVRPAGTRIERIPATYRTVSEKVLVSPARTEWKVGHASSFAAGSVVDTRSSEAGEIMCLVEVPAVYETISKDVIDQPATSREITVPAEYTTVTKQVIVTPATTREVVIPAEYKTVKVSKLAEPSAERRTSLPAEYRTVTKREKIRDERTEWRQVVCDVNLTTTNVRTLQTALAGTGNYKGPIDGILGPQTFSAANSYARMKGLPTGSNYIVMEVIDDLDLSL